MNESFVHILCFLKSAAFQVFVGRTMFGSGIWVGGGSGVWVIVWISMGWHGVPPVGAWTGSFHGWKSPRVPIGVVLPWCNVRDLVQMLHSHLLSCSAGSHNIMCIHENSMAHTHGRFSCCNMTVMHPPQLKGYCPHSNPPNTIFCESVTIVEMLNCSKNRIKSSVFLNTRSQMIR